MNHRGTNSSIITVQRSARFVFVFGAYSTGTNTSHITCGVDCFSSEMLLLSAKGRWEFPDFNTELGFKVLYFPVSL